MYANHRGHSEPTSGNKKINNLKKNMKSDPEFGENALKIEEEATN